MSGLLVAGTTSDAGKSVVTTALCRAFARRGAKVAPYKAQNMSNNSMVVAGPDGRGAEIGRAQWIQAIAAGLTPEVAMNPVLLKPGSDQRSHVVLNGRPYGTLSAASFLSDREPLAAAAFEAYDDLAGRFEVVVAEGAGSPAEINLRPADYVNMGLARRFSLPTVVVADIDRGGMFASLYGTVALLSPEDQALVSGFVVNRFRGSRSLLQPGLDSLAELTGRPFYGVLPWNPDLWLDSEDALDLAGRRSSASGGLTVAVVRLPRISNFTDVDALGIEPSVDVVFAASPQDLAGADLVVLPGTRATIADLAWLRGRGLDEAIVRHARRGGAVLGICGGYQMLGRSISDPQGVEGPPCAVPGLGLLDVTTTFAPEKTLALVSGTALGCATTGYEIHHGTVTRHSGDAFLDGTADGNVAGTLWHGSLEGDDFRHALLSWATGASYSSTASFAASRAARLDLLADLAEEHLDVPALLDLALSGAPTVPLLPPGAAS